MDAVRRSTKEARKFFIGDLRRVEKKGFPEPSFIIELFDHLPVNIQNEQSDDKVRYTEVDIPRALTTLAPVLAGLTGLLRPDQKMCNWIQRERAKGLAKIPPHAPYLAPRLSSTPGYRKSQSIAIATITGRRTLARPIVSWPRKRSPPPRPKLVTLPHPLSHDRRVIFRLCPLWRLVCSD